MMNINSALILLFLMALAVCVPGQDTNTNTTVVGNATLDNNETVSPSMAPSMIPTMVPTMAPTWAGNISPECANETEALSQSEQLATTLMNLLDNYRDEFKQECPFTLTDTGCSVSFGGNTTYQAVCEQLGGQVFEHKVVLQCGIQPLNTDYDLGVVPECIGQSCNVSTVDTSLLGNGNITNFASRLDNGGCEGKIDSGAFTTRSHYGAMVGAIIIATVGVAFLF